MEKSSKQMTSNHHPSPFSRLISILDSERDHLGWILVYGAAVALFSLVIPIAAQALVNTVAFNSLIQPIVVLTFIVLGMLSVASILSLIQTSVVELLQQRIFARVALDLAYRLPRWKLEIYDQEKAPELLNRFFEILTVQKAAALMLLHGLAIVLQAIIGMILLAFYHPLLLAFDVFLILGIFLVLWLPAKRAIATSILESKAKYKVAGWLEEIARSPFVFKFAGGAEYALTRADEMTFEYLKARKAHFAVLIRQVGGTLLVHTLVSGLLLGLGSLLVIKKQLTLGQLVAAEIVVNMVVSGLASSGKYLETYYDLMASVDKIGHLFEFPLEGEVELSPTLISGGLAPFSVRLKKVNFSYVENTSFHLSDVDLHILPGARVGLSGPNASGKSTLLDVIAGLRPPGSGIVELNSLDLREVKVQAIRDEIAFVRGVSIFDGTIFENIRVGREKVALEDARAALARVELLEEVSVLPEGLMTSLSGSLNPLSAGQRQKLMLARAIVGKPRLLILDEALEAIDVKTKIRILQTLFDPSEPWTLILSSNERLELAFCSQVVKLQAGKLYPDDRVPSSLEQSGKAGREVDPRVSPRVSL